MHKIMIAAACGAAALAAFGAMAQETTEVVITTGHLAAMDSNADGHVDRDEFKTFVNNQVGKLDKDADGAVSWSEAELGMDRNTFDALDANKNSSLSRSEVEAQSEKDFAAADRDGSGVLN